MIPALLLLWTPAFAGPRTATVEAERVIEAPAAEVWRAMVVDYGRISDFSPYIYASDYRAGSLMGEVGAERRCAFDESGKRWTHERIVELDPVSMRMKNVVTEAAKFPLDREVSYAWYAVDDNGDGTSTARYSFTYRTKPGIMTGLVKGSFRKTLEGTLVGLEHFIETGERVNATTGNWDEVRERYE